MKAKPRKALERYKGKSQTIRERFEKPEGVARRIPPTRKRIPEGMGDAITTPMMPVQMGGQQPMQPQPIGGIAGTIGRVLGGQIPQQIQQPAMPSMVGAPMQPYMPQQSIFQTMGRMAGAMPQQQQQSSLFGTLGRTIGGMMPQQQQPMMPQQNMWQNYRMPQYRRY